MTIYISMPKADQCIGFIL